MIKGFFKIELEIISTYAKCFEKTNICYPQYTQVYMSIGVTNVVFREIPYVH